MQLLEDAAGAPIDISKASAISFDIETLGIPANSVCLSIGAVSFNPFMREVVPQAHEKIHLHLPMFAQMDMGRHVDLRTVDWWHDQTAAARTELYKSMDQVESLEKVLEQFRVWLLRTKPTHGYWSRGPMDHNIIDSLLPGVIPYYLWRDQRTLCAMAPTLYIPRMAAHTEHDAYEDALYQARYISAVHAQITEDQDERAALLATRYTAPTVQASTSDGPFDDTPPNPHAPPPPEPVPASGVLPAPKPLSTERKQFTPNSGFTPQP